MFIFINTNKTPFSKLCLTGGVTGGRKIQENSFSCMGQLLRGGFRVV